MQNETRNEIMNVQETEEKRKTARFYTHVIVFYGREEELKPLFDSARAWAYIVHDRTPGTDRHIHAIITFDREKSFKWVRDRVVSNSTILTEPMESDVKSVLEYFTHKNTDKEKYDESELVFHDKDYWTKRAGTDGKEEDKNEEFVDDLLADNYSLEKMSRKYGRDYIKNFRKYEEARNAMLYEHETSAKRRNEQEREALEMMKIKQIQETIEWLNKNNWRTNE